ncbi:MAG TPA: DUF488 domain-containing protein [Steroidobacteraceae bacterium]|jgi:uncharacterized protein (DUF488 family)|nr:DUF488 domain-containing protein [Steroidobacteraceae bacterium]
MTSPVVYTIGHSSQPIEEFIGALKKHGIGNLADVRSIPYSRRFPQFSREALQKSLVVDGIGYLYLGRELGARRDEPECYVDGRAAYGEIAKLPNFQRGLHGLVTVAQRRRTALMCSEQDPLTCHRVILICHEMRQSGLTILHILRGGELEAHEDAEKRLIDEELGGAAQPDLFPGSRTCDERLEDAYRRRALRISYRRDELKRSF